MILKYVSILASIFISGSTNQRMDDPPQGSNTHFLPPSFGSSEPQPETLSCYSISEPIDLICICTLNSESESKAYRMSEVIRQHFYLRTILGGLTFKDCSFVISANDMASIVARTIEFRSERSLNSNIFVGTNGLTFNHSERVVVKFSNILQLQLDRFSFGTQVSSVSIFGVSNLEKFSTDAFANMKEEFGAMVSIKNCNLTSPQSGNHLVSLSSFMMRNVLAGELSSSSTLNLKARSVRISNVKMDLTAHHALQFSLAEMIEFKQCKISFLAPSPIAAKAHNFRFSGCTLYGLNLDSLVELTGVDNQSEISFINTTLIGPTRGSLVNQFPNIVFDNMLVKKCWCDQSKVFLSGLASQSSGHFSESQEKVLSTVLNNNTFCEGKLSGEILQLSFFCQNQTSDSGNSIIVAFFSIALLFLFTLGIFAIYRYNDNIKKRYEMMKMWTFVLPAAAYARETIVKFDMEKVKYFSRPTSNVFSIDASQVEEWTNTNPSIVVQQTEPVYQNVNGLTPTHRPFSPLTPIEEQDEFLRSSCEFGDHTEANNPDEDEDEEEEVEINSKFKRIQTRKIRKTRPSSNDDDDDESITGSVVIHEDFAVKQCTSL